MKPRVLIFAMLVSVTALPSHAQSGDRKDEVKAPSDKKEVRSGNRKFRRDNFKEAEIDYRRALIKDSTSVVANYNLANTLYRQEDFEGARKYMENAEGNEACPDVLFNKGSIAIKNQEYNTAVDAFKEYLLKNPDDLDAKKNYVYAKRMLQQQQQNQQQQQQQQNQQDKQQQQQDKQDKNQQDQQDKDKQNQDNNQQQQQNQQDNQDRQQDKNGNQDRQPQISPQAARQMIEAIQAKEKDTQEKVKEAEAYKMKSRQKEKNW